MSLPNLTFEVNSPYFTVEEQALANELGQRLMLEQGPLQLLNDYYEGTFRVRHLGIAVPENLQTLRTVMGWPSLAVDTLAERTTIDGFILPGSDQADQDLWDIWLANGMELASNHGHIDNFVFGRFFVIVGKHPTEDYPLVTVESPENMVANFNAVTGQVTEALQVYEIGCEQYVALYTQKSTIHLHKPEGGDWQFVSRDDHELGRPPVVMLANRSRSRNRYGCSEITPAVMYFNDAACRTLLRLEITQEFFSAPTRYLLGIDEEAFLDASGTPQKAWETYIGRMLGIPRDANGDVPTTGSFPASDPTPHISVLVDLSKRFAAVTGLPPHMVGYAADNPASADGINAADARLDKRAELKHSGLTPGWRDVALLMMQFAGMPAPDKPYKLMPDWRDPSTPTELETAQALFYEVQMGYMPADSEIVGQRLGYTATERAQIAADRQRAQRANALDAITARLAARQQPGMNSNPNPNSGAVNGVNNGLPQLPSSGTRFGGLPQLRAGRSGG